MKVCSIVLILCYLTLGVLLSSNDDFSINCVWCYHIYDIAVIMIRVLCPVSIDITLSVVFVVL